MTILVSSSVLYTSRAGSLSSSDLTPVAFIVNLRQSVIYFLRQPMESDCLIICRLTSHLLPHTVPPRVTSLYYTSSTTNVTFTCTSRNSPATTVTWMKDGDTLDIDGEKYKTYQTVTNRRTSTYENTLVVDGVIENITGNYTCKVTNKFGSSSRDLTVRGTLLSN